MGVKEERTHIRNQCMLRNFLLSYFEANRNTILRLALLNAELKKMTAAYTPGTTVFLSDYRDFFPFLTILKKIINRSRV